MGTVDARLLLSLVSRILKRAPSIAAPRSRPRVVIAGGPRRPRPLPVRNIPAGSPGGCLDAPVLYPVRPRSVHPPPRLSASREAGEARKLAEAAPTSSGAPACGCVGVGAHCEISDSWASKPAARLSNGAYSTESSQARESDSLCISAGPRRHHRAVGSARSTSVAAPAPPSPLSPTSKTTAALRGNNPFPGDRRVRAVHCRLVRGCRPEAPHLLTPAYCHHHRHHHCYR